LRELLNGRKDQAYFTLSSFSNHNQLIIAQSNPHFNIFLKSCLIKDEPLCKQETLRFNAVPISDFFRSIISIRKAAAI